jgi:hypothetical protein
MRTSVIRTAGALVLAAGSLLALAGDATAQQGRRGALEQRFNQLSQAAQAAQKQGAIQTKSVRIKGSAVTVAVGKFNISSPGLSAGSDPYQLGVKVWGELIGGPDAGKYVNMVKHKWQRGENFYLWFDTAVPAELAIFQNYANDTSPTRRVVPDDQYPESFMTFFPGQPKRFPLAFHMDDDLNDEIMAIVVARTDSGLPLNEEPKDQAARVDGHEDIASNPDRGNPNRGNPYPAGDGAGGVGGTLKGHQEAMAKFNQQALGSNTINGKSTKFDIQGPPTVAPPISTSPDDVSHVLLCVGKIGHLQLTLHKD